MGTGIGMMLVRYRTAEFFSTGSERWTAARKRRHKSAHRGAHGMFGNGLSICPDYCREDTMKKYKFLGGGDNILEPIVQ